MLVVNVRCGFCLLTFSSLSTPFKCDEKEFWNREVINCFLYTNSPIGLPVAMTPQTHTHNPVHLYDDPVLSDILPIIRYTICLFVCLIVCFGPPGLVSLHTPSPLTPQQSSNPTYKVCYFIISNKTRIQQQCKSTTSPAPCSNSPHLHQWLPSLYRLV